MDALRARQELEAFKAGRDEANRRLQESLATFHANRARAVAPESVAPPAPAMRKIRSKQGGWSREQAASLCPPGATISKDGPDHRWRIDAPFMRSSKSRCWGQVTQQTDYQAMLFVLGCCWADFERGGGDPCPWEAELA